MSKMLWVGLGLFLLLASSAQAQTTYYVDPDHGSCSDAGAGTSTSAPWCTLPGSRNAANSADLNTNSVSCGDTILLYGGSTQDSADGGMTNISTTRYQDCGLSSESPITIKLATSGEWSGSSGDFTFDGTGVTTNPGLIVFATNADKVHLRGLSSTEFGDGSDARIIVRDSTNEAIRAAGDRIWIDHIYSTGNTLSTICTQDLQDSLMTNIEAESNTGGGVFPGCFSDGAMDATEDRIALIGFSLHGSTGTGGNCTNQTDGFGIMAVQCDSCFFIDGDIYSNSCSGVFTGNVEADWRDQSTHYREVRVRDHNAPTVPSNPVNWLLSGDESPGSGFENMHTIVRSVSVGSTSEGISTHDGGYVDMWHMTHWGDGTSSGCQVVFDRGFDFFSVYNSLSHDPVDTFSNTCYIQSGGAVDMEVRSQNTTYSGLATGDSVAQHDQTCSEDANLGCNRDSDCSGTCGWTSVGTTFTYASPPEWMADEATITTTATAPAFVDGSPATGAPYTESDYQSIDLQLTEGDPAIDAGRCVMVTTNSGTSSTGPINVESNTDDAGTLASLLIDDPRRYFYACDPDGDTSTTSFYCPTAAGIPLDPIEIGTTETTVASLTGSSITVSDSISWSSGACVHWPYEGSAPDRGAYEFTPAASPSGGIRLRLAEE